MPRPPRDPSDDLTDPELEGAIAAYVAANPDSPAAQMWRTADAPARPAQMAGIRVRPHVDTPEEHQSRVSAELMARGARGEDLSSFQTRPGPGARAPPMKAATTPEGEAMFADLKDAALEQATQDRLLRVTTVPTPPPESALPEQHWMRRLGSSVGGAAKDAWNWLNEDPNVSAQRLQAEEAARARTAAASPPATAPSARMPPPAARAPSQKPTRQWGVGRPAQVEVPNTAVVQSMDPGPQTLTPPAAAAPPATAAPTALDLALARARDNRLIAGMVRAGGTAIGRGTGPGYDALDENADRPLAELGMRQDADARAKAQALAAAENDPNSPQSQQARAILGEMVPGFAKRAEFASMTAAQAKAMFPQAGKLFEGRMDLEKTRLHNQGEIDKLRAKRGAAAGGVKEADVQKFGKDTEGLAKIQADVQLVERLAATPEGQDIPGAGWWDTKKPAFMQSPSDTDAYQATMRVAAELLHQQSGAAVTPSEAERFLESRGMGKGTTEQQFRAGAKALVRDLRAELAAKSAKYRPEVRETLRKRGGVVDLPAGAPATEVGAPRKQYSPSRNQTRLIYPDGRVEVRNGRI